MSHIPGSYCCCPNQATSKGTRYLIAPTSNLRSAIAKLALLFSDLHPAIANVAQQIANVAQQFSDLRLQIANVAQQFGIAGPQYGSVAGQLKTQPSALRQRSAI